MTKPTASELRVPQTTWANTSLPWPVVPSRWCADGRQVLRRDHRERVPGRDERRQQAHDDQEDHDHGTEHAFLLAVSRV